ncbi:cyclin-dependent kinase inhibitor 5-like isoform X1 [Typha angustifolia]|uniref:cyclin-dependent kinase inhibitor 5-like isoform X1 n=1 Tax=Typha angustifolia TaxID=59011 RepID=UPI003C2BBF29
MGKYLRKCKEIGELAVMEVTQVVGVRTRAKTLALAAAEGARSRGRKAGAASELQISYLQLRSRNVLMKPRTTRTEQNSGGRRRSTVDLGRISRCSSNASCEVPPEEPPLRYIDRDDDGEDCSIGSRETTPTSALRDKRADLESTAGMAPPEAEIEEFFAAAERAERRRFADKYNYDVVGDAPLEGRYEWARLNP